MGCVIVFCSHCGSKLEDNARFCSQCGHAVLHPPSTETVPKEKIRIDKPVAAEAAPRTENKRKSAFSTIAISMAKGLLIAIAIIAVTIVIAHFLSQTLAILFATGMSVYFTLRSYRKKWPLTRMTAILPAISATACFLLQIFILPIQNLNNAWLIGAAMAGLIAGYLRSRGHKILIENGQLYAQKTPLFLVIWAMTFFISQGAAFTGLRQLAIVGLTLNAFGTVGVIAVAIFLFSQVVKRGQLKQPTPATLSPGGE